MILTCRILHRILKEYTDKGRGFASQSKKHSTYTDEVRVFSELASQWHNEDGPFKALHSLNVLRVPWIVQNVNKKNGSVVDVGCGGGLLSIPLARAGFHVTGIDASEGAVRAARELLESRVLRVSGLHTRISFHCTNVEDFSKEHIQEYDAVVASEIIEHVVDLDSFVGDCVRLAKPGASLFFTTINKTLASRILAVWLAEDVMGLVPQGVHQWRKFVEPVRLSAILERHGCSVKSISGLTLNPITSVWSWIPTACVNYACLAVKN